MRIESREYCQEESFTARCQSDEALVMRSARYGRMHIGRCVTRNLGYLGCAVDALRLLDSRCSGHQTCDVSIMDAALRDMQPCPKDVTWHLAAAFDCVKGLLVFS